MVLYSSVLTKLCDFFNSDFGSQVYYTDAENGDHY